ncbi:MAG TPA: PEP-CTERM sorting domain-containing protein, partial [Bradyrhizobium sp.]|nr:PEP-CTERM sorting domain-containing protein [Bradyrhizobium sp.]
TVHLVNANSLLDRNFRPNPNNRGVHGGNGTSVIHVLNNGQWNLAAPDPIPEPSTVGLLGVGLIFLGFFMNRREKRSVL